jgi:hypothetical protein
MRTAFDRAVMSLGAASVASGVFTFVRGDLEFVTVRAGGLAVALVLGGLAFAAGWMGSRALSLLCGAAFLLSAGVLLTLLGTRGNGGFLDGSGSTFGLWLGLGVGLVALGATSRDPGARRDDRT